MRSKKYIAVLFVSLGSLVTAFLYLCPLRIYRLNTVNMEPTILKGDIVVVNKVAYITKLPQRWDIVTYSPPSKSSPGKNHILSCSRIVGLPGEVLNFDAAGLTINGIPLQNPCGSRIKYKGPKNLSEIEIKSYKVSKIEFPYVIPFGSFFLIGDNAESRDSRYFGSVTRSQLDGKVVKVF